ncbi:hypothetical protein FHY30_000490 [Xanthomonas arboricola]|uniref:hypothetical protein n=1 Tax=Xanthomonas campestris TaxID=339 RepID=UPI0023E9D831|nr:hypothetical protein [Xanthomonas campestris]
MSKRRSLIAHLLIAATIFLSCNYSYAANPGEEREHFVGWLGKNQKSFYEDGDYKKWASCLDGKNGDCSASTKSTTVGACRTTGFDIGAAWEMPFKIPGLSLSGNANHSWTECNERSESTECKPHVGFKGGTAVLVSERWGRTKYFGIEPIPGDGEFPKNYKQVTDPDYGLGYFWIYTGPPITHDGYLPEYRAFGCQYVRPWQS